MSLAVPRSPRAWASRRRVCRSCCRSLAAPSMKRRYCGPLTPTKKQSPGASGDPCSILLAAALPPTPAPEPVGDPATRDMVVAACHRAGLSLNEDQIAMICAAGPYVTPGTQWLRRERDFRDEPANIFQFPC